MSLFIYFSFCQIYCTLSMGDPATPQSRIAFASSVLRKKVLGLRLRYNRPAGRRPPAPPPGAPCSCTPGVPRGAAPMTLPVPPCAGHDHRLSRWFELTQKDLLPACISRRTKSHPICPTARKRAILVLLLTCHHPKSIVSSSAVPMLEAGAFYGTPPPAEPAVSLTKKRRPPRNGRGALFPSEETGVAPKKKIKPKKISPHRDAPRPRLGGRALFAVLINPS